MLVIIIFLLHEGKQACRREGGEGGEVEAAPVLIHSLTHSLAEVTSQPSAVCKSDRSCWNNRGHILLNMNTYYRTTPSCTDGDAGVRGRGRGSECKNDNFSYTTTTKWSFPLYIPTKHLLQFSHVIPGVIFLCIC